MPAARRFQRLFRRRDGEKVRTRVLENAGRLPCPMSEGVGLDDGDDLGRLGRPLGQQRPHGVKIVPQGAPADGNPGVGRHGVGHSVPFSGGVSALGVGAATERGTS